MDAIKDLGEQAELYCRFGGLEPGQNGQIAAKTGGQVRKLDLNLPTREVKRTSLVILYPARQRYFP